MPNQYHEIEVPSPTFSFNRRECWYANDWIMTLQAATQTSLQQTLQATTQTTDRQTCNGGTQTTNPLREQDPWCWQYRHDYHYYEFKSLAARRLYDTRPFINWSSIVLESKVTERLVRIRDAAERAALYRTIIAILIVSNPTRDGEREPQKPLTMKK
jgi:hypothetical protein